MIYSQSESKIVFSADAGIQLAQISAKWKGKVFLLTDENTLKFCFPKIKASLTTPIEVYTIKAGEQYKHIQTVERVWEFLNTRGADRKSLLINLGGGVLCDLGGFAASTFKRGIDFVHVPTTLLSQVDASVGGKTGVNFKSFKNEIGSFSFPLQVIIDTTFLETLDQENMLSGFAEMLKHAFISDENYYHHLKEIDFGNDKIDYARLLDLVKYSVRIKEKLVLADPLEKGQRKILNFGHTIGHAFESYYMGTDKEISHGRAVASGMGVELFLSFKKAGFPKEKLIESVGNLNEIYGKLNFGFADFDALYGLMIHDKKNESAKINFTLISDFGQAVFDQTATREEIFEGLAYYIQS